jgi:hypothetical protein
MNEADLSYIYPGEDLAPETALEQLKQATTVEGMLYILRDVMSHFALAVLKAKADDVTKARAFFYLGQIEDALSALGEIISTVIVLRPNNNTEEDLYRFMKEHIATFIRMYADIRNGKPLENVIGGLNFEATALSASIRDYNILIRSDISRLRREPENFTIKL